MVTFRGHFELRRWASRGIAAKFQGLATSVFMTGESAFVNASSPYY